MRALTFRGVQDIRLETVADPVLRGAGDAIVRVERAGLCGSDLHVYHGREVCLDPGTVMGHEVVGRVVEGWNAGARVVAPFSTACGRCFYCLRGLSARCVHGELFGWVQDSRGLEGAQAEFVRVPRASSTLVQIDEDLPAELALLLADVVPTGWYVARDLCEGAVVVVIGCGPIGLSAVVAAHEQGAHRVFAIDDVPERLDLAARFGAEPLNRHGDLSAMVGEATEGRGADAALEVVGSEGASRLAFDLVRPGGVVSIAGVHHEARFAFSPVEAYDKNVTMRIGRCPARSLMEELRGLLAKRPDLREIVTHVRPLSEGVDAYRMFDRKEDGCIKVAFTP